MTGAHGLAARPVTALERFTETIGSMSMSPGIGGGPSGLPMALAPIVRSTVGLPAMALLPSVSNNPPAIHLRNSASSLSANLPRFGGMFGSDRKSVV